MKLSSFSAVPFLCLGLPISYSENSQHNLTVQAFQDFLPCCGSERKVWHCLQMMEEQEETWVSVYKFQN